MQQRIKEQQKGLKKEQTFGRPVLPLVYMTTAIPFLDGKLGGTGLLLPSFSTSEKDAIVHLLVLPETVSFSVPSSSKYITFCILFRLGLIASNFFNCLESQISVDTWACQNFIALS